MIHHIICLAGYKTAGKDTTADIMQKFLTTDGAHVFTYAFADAVRMTCHRVFPDVERYIWWNDGMKDVPMAGMHNCTPRYWMRQIAQAIRAMDKNFWSTHVLDQISTNTGSLLDGPVQDGVTVHIIKDLRFEEDWLPIMRRVINAKSNLFQQGNKFTARIWWIESNMQPDGHASEDFTWLDAHRKACVHHIDNTARTIEALTDEVVHHLYSLK